MHYYKDLGIRIALAFLLNPSVLYFIFAPLTLFFSYLVLFPYNPEVSYLTKSITLHGSKLDFVEGCIAPAAYYLLTLLILLTKDIKLKTKVLAFLTGFSLIFVMNLLRILFIAFILLNFGKNWFDSLHLIFWDFFSIAYVLLVWLFIIKWFKIKSIPVYDDLKELYKRAFPRKI